MRLVQLAVNCLKETVRNDDTTLDVTTLLDGTLAKNPEYATEVNNVLLSINKAISRLMTAGKIPLKHAIMSANSDIDTYSLADNGITDVRAIRSVYIMKDGAPIMLGWTLVAGNMLYLGYGLKDTIHIQYERKIPNFTEDDYELEIDLDANYGLNDELCNYINYFVKSELFEDRDPDRCKRYLNYFEQFIAEINPRETIVTQKAIRAPYRIK